MRLNMRAIRIAILLGLIGTVAGAIWWQRRSGQGADAAIAVPAADSVASALRPLTCPHSESTKENVLSLINRYRTAIGLPAAEGMALLDQYAQLRADELAASQEMGHESAHGNLAAWIAQNDKLEEAKDLKEGGRELLAKDYPDACAVVDSWKKEDRSGILEDEKARRFGVGLNGSIVVVVDATPL